MATIQMAKGPVCMTTLTAPRVLLCGCGFVVSPSSNETDFEYIKLKIVVIRNTRTNGVHTSVQIAEAYTKGTVLKFV
jgi:hypothetical protein